MKKLFILMIFLLHITGCGKLEDAQIAVHNYLNNYIDNNEIVATQLNSFVDNEELTNGQKDLYKEALNRQYQDLQYEILNIEYDDNDAIISVRITVYDYYKVQKDAEEYLTINPAEFLNSGGEYDKDIFFEYKLNQMNKTTYNVEYILDLIVTKNNGKWYVNQPSKISLEKIHGIYNYENR